MRRAAFLDRDGVINPYVYNADFGTVDSPSSPAEFTLGDGVGEAVAELNRLGLAVIVVSNQPGIAKGKFTPALLQDVTSKMKVSVAAAGGKLDAVYYCLHHPEAAATEYRAICDCRKPRPGLLLQAAQEWQIDLAGSFMIGDGLTDIEAGRAAGTRTIFIGQSKNYIHEEFERRGIKPDYVAAALPHAVEIIRVLEQKAQSGHANLSPQSEIQPPERSKMTYSAKYFAEAIEILGRVDAAAVEKIADRVAEAREKGGRVFFIGVGGGAGHASHAVCDFRKIAGIEAYAPTDNVSELTARINDDGWDTSYANWLRGSRLGKNDVVFVFSVGGGDLARNISPNLVRALQYAKEVGAGICGVVGRDGGYTAQVADACVTIPVVNPANVTPHTEAFQALVWHLLVSHPRLKAAEMKWESVR
jgi:D-sedoheptulose 7-phosphate isomerase